MVSVYELLFASSGHSIFIKLNRTVKLARKGSNAVDSGVKRGLKAPVNEF